MADNVTRPLKRGGKYCVAGGPDKVSCQNTTYSSEISMHYCTCSIAYRVTSQEAYLAPVSMRTFCRKRQCFGSEKYINSQCSRADTRPFVTYRDYIVQRELKPTQLVRTSDPKFCIVPRSWAVKTAMIVAACPIFSWFTAAAAAGD